MGHYQILKETDITFENLNFWNYYVTCFRGFDDVKELNLDDAIGEVTDTERYIPDFGDWYRTFLPEAEADDEGYFKQPKAIAGRLGDDMSFAIEFHLCETNFYLNSTYIGCLGGHSQARFLTLDELLAFDRYGKLFLLLPMTGVEELQRELAESLVSERLKSIAIFAAEADYIAKCIVNGLMTDKPFYKLQDTGIVCDANHSVRNVVKYPRYKDDVTELNRALEAFVGRTNDEGETR